ncbi:nicotinate-nucleotide--dimethylbenzimidazole phosphoribosyltransferase [Clostridium estertheticum]|uniref:Nicotinate-nucleotide--dimethylbenzimidazole phosphoribosyltransferase n=2 Tax=Clostridium estertheticum TaxID=238834 RepID=A0A1J0GM18_9CLOT|nr:nicotinate-nucleotide--dimethylbenzimidazole phosphoribosyltransferase [Clostridium estertheticum]APC41984.1 nicotinate-nucleotide--dimethylbenzimidazole phosphoribosyltransferase [Clostridium estertheticum subsp. estertheticum]MBU3073162.1 nicotinate-nucleotide--dimethylbenzimidazole phosphoribosyltransferase [Clostridium estertheticum]MBU3163597.1 nicotinate-nucleotide--dimethylbenzimidazole phosphoribosyltransferase [Clostridium estertheticum]MBZ9616111.1 nicotinate-nucleotide--dimethylbe
MGLLKETLQFIEPLNKEAVKKAWDRLDSLSKPIGSLGELENIIAKMAGITGNIHNKINKKNVVIMCSDNGVVEENVSNCPKSVTATVTNNFTKKITGVYVLSKFSGSDITVVDVGIDADLNNPKVINKKIAYGTMNMMKGPAMTREQTIKAIEVGIETVDNLVLDGYDLLGTGEMGVGNTATSAAILSVFSGLEVEESVGKGSGITEEQFINKKRVIKKSIEVNKPDKNDVIDVISKVGGFDIAGLCGCFLAAAKNRVPIVIDGFIASAAALCAYKLNPLVIGYIFASHLSAEPGADFVMKEIGLKPMLNLNMRLGEGSGCPLAFNIIEAALYTMDNMGTFEDAKLDSKKYIDIRENPLEIL